MNGISWLLLVLILLAVVWVIVFKIKNRDGSGCGGSCSSCGPTLKKKGNCSGSEEHIIHIQKMGR